MAFWPPSAKDWFIPILSFTKTELNVIIVLVELRTEREVNRGSTEWVESIFPRNVERPSLLSTGVD